MYIGKTRTARGMRYALRQSCREGDCLTSRDLFDLGEDPGDWVEYPGGNGFYYRTELTEALESSCGDYSSEDLDEAFLPYLQPHVRRVLEAFRSRGPSAPKESRAHREDRLRRQKGLTPFDFRRVHYLRCGRIDAGDTESLPLGFCTILLDKSRDEIEHLMERMEGKLRPREIRSYLYCALHLARYSPGNLLRHHPFVLDPEKQDELFLQEVCFLNANPVFFLGVSGWDASLLHPYLSRYVILYFDHSYHAEPWADGLRDGMHRRRFRGREGVRATPVPDLDEALTIMGLQRDELTAMSRTDLMRLYRQRAKTAHPDAGGDHDRFVRLREAFEVLMVRKGRYS